MHSMLVMGTLRAGAVCLEEHTFDLWGSYGLLLPLERRKIIWDHHRVSKCSYKGVGKVLGHHKLKERKNMKD